MHLHDDVLINISFAPCLLMSADAASSGLPTAFIGAYRHQGVDAHAWQIQLRISRQPTRDAAREKFLITIGVFCNQVSPTHER
jgi:hypothetical protein